MTEREWLTDRFEENRSHLKSVAYRMLGSISDADDAVQEAWLRLNRSNVDRIENLSGWLTTVVARVCLDVLRSRKARREESLEAAAARSIPSRRTGIDPEQETLLANSVGLALLVILDTLGPAERLAFVMHDMFGTPFDEIAPIVGRTPEAARQLASRARRRVQGSGMAPDARVSRQREVVDAFLAAARKGDFEALMTLLDPDVVVRSDAFVLPAGAPREVRGAAMVADRALKGRARAAQPILVNGDVGVIVAPRGRLLMVMAFTIANGKIVEIEAIADPERLGRIELAVLGDEKSF